MQSSSFSIRFRPASARERKDELGIDDDDVCDDGFPSHNGTCDSVLFERLSNAEDQIPSVEYFDGRPPVTHPDSLWNNSQAILSHSAPVSELTSPMLPSATGAVPVMHEKPAVIKPLVGSQQFSEKTSIFSGLKEKLDKLSSESKEMFDRKMKRSGSADAAKIASLLCEPDVAKSDAAKNEGIDESTAIVVKSDSIQQTDDQQPDVTEERIVEDSSVSPCSGGDVHRSTSSIELTKADIVSTSAATWKRPSLGGECGQEPVVMSRLLSSTSQTDSRQYFSTPTRILQSSESSQNDKTEIPHATDVRPLRKQKRFIFTARFRYLFSLLLAVVTCVIVPMPPYVAGMLVGAFLSAMTILLYQRLTRSKHAATVSSRDVQSTASITADIRESKNSDGKFQVCIKGTSLFVCIICDGLIEFVF